MSTPANPPADLVAWLRQQLDDDEEVASDAAGLSASRSRWMRDAISCVVDATDNGLIVYGEGTPTPEQAEHIARHDPARILREVEVKRRIMEKHGASDRMEYSYFLCTGCSDGHPCDTLRLLALPYDDHPECREEWRPTP